MYRMSLMHLNKKKGSELNKASMITHIFIVRRRAIVTLNVLHLRAWSTQKLTSKIFVPFKIPLSALPLHHTRGGMEKLTYS